MFKAVTCIVVLYIVHSFSPAWQAQPLEGEPAPKRRKVGRLPPPLNKSVGPVPGPDQNMFLFAIALVSL